MPNLIPNATGLEVTGWAAYGVSSAPLTFDETVNGSPGRGVVVAQATGDGGEVALDAPAFAVPAVARLWLQSEFAAGHANAEAVVIWFNGSNAEITREALPLVREAEASNARRGLPKYYNLAAGFMNRPSGAVSAILRLTADEPASGAPVFLAMMRPLAAVNRVCWTPGEHTSPDLDLDVWPDSLPELRELQSPRTPTRKSFATDAGIPASWRIGTRGRILFEAEMRPTLEQRDTLDQFFEARVLVEESAPFWFVHPDTRQLCRAWFNPEVEISDAGRGPERTTRVGLILEIA